MQHTESNQTPSNPQESPVSAELRKALQGDLAELTTLVLEQAQERSARHINALFGVERHNHPEYMLLNLLIERLQEAVGH